MAKRSQLVVAVRGSTGAARVATSRSARRPCPCPCAARSDVRAFAPHPSTEGECCARSDDCRSAESHRGNLRRNDRTNDAPHARRQWLHFACRRTESERRGGGCRGVGGPSRTPKGG